VRQDVPETCNLVSDGWCDLETTKYTTKLAAVGVLIVCLHTAWSGPCIGIKGVDAVLLRSLAQKDLATILAIPDISGVVCRYFGWRARTLGENGVHKVTVAV
jgi:hypothetical protein